jgi:hypothetical protein
MRLPVAQLARQAGMLAVDRAEFAVGTPRDNHG